MMNFRWPFLAYYSRSLAATWPTPTARPRDGQRTASLIAELAAVC